MGKQAHAQHAGDLHRTARRLFVVFARFFRIFVDTHSTAQAMEYSAGQRKTGKTVDETS